MSMHWGCGLAADHKVARVAASGSHGCIDDDDDDDDDDDENEEEDEEEEQQQEEEEEAEEQDDVNDHMAVSCFLFQSISFE